jgi:acetyltransferase-like isoleucine patch superfamily enzyme
MLKKGDYSYGNINVKTWTRKNVIVNAGKFCSFANNITIVIDGNHRMDTFSTFPFREIFKWGECPLNNYGKETPVIGNDVWIGENVTIYSGVTIGDGAVIAGNSVVTKSVPPYAIVAGNPASIKKYRFTDSQIRDLLNYKWWDLPIDVIRSRLIPVIDNIDKVISVLKEIRGA